MDWLPILSVKQTLQGNTETSKFRISCSELNSFKTFTKFGIFGVGAITDGEARSGLPDDGDPGLSDDFGDGGVAK